MISLDLVEDVKFMEVTSEDRKYFEETARIWGMPSETAELMSVAFSLIPRNYNGCARNLVYDVFVEEFRGERS